VFVQHLYDKAFLTPVAMQALNITGDESVPPRGKLERDAAGQPTGVVDADIATLNQIIDKLPTADFAQQVEGTKRYFRELNRLGLTGVNDVTGGGMFPVHYRPVETVWRDRQLTLRVAFHFQSQHRGKEFEDYQQYTTFLPQGFGDDLLRFEGLGEGLTWAMYDGSTIGTPFNPSEEAREAYYKIALWAAQQGLTVHQHATSDRAASLILDAFERVDKEVPIGGLRWQLTHIEDASERTLERMKALNMGWSVQDRLLYAGAHFVKVAGAEAGRRAPPIKTGLKLGLMVAAGTDSDQVAPYNPFVSLRWLLDGKAIDGTPVRGPEESPSREEALEMYTRNAAWFVHAEDRRGSLEPGKLADLAVLSKDYMTVPVEEVGEIQSLLTMLGGKVVYAAGPYAQLEARM
jgi:predicted amidohydrolase YtcJ